MQNYYYNQYAKIRPTHQMVTNYQQRIQRDIKIFRTVWYGRTISIKFNMTVI